MIPSLLITSTDQLLKFKQAVLLVVLWSKTTHAVTAMLCRPTYRLQLYSCQYEHSTGKWTMVQVDIGIGNRPQRSAVSKLPATTLFSLPAPVQIIGYIQGKAYFWGSLISNKKKGKEN